MSSFEEPKTDFFRRPVPAERRVSGWEVALVVYGIGITLPIFFLGSELGETLGLRDAAIAFFGGCLLLGILASATAIVGARTGLSSYMIIEFSFGRDGAKIVNFLMAIALLGYFGATADIFGQAVRDAVQSVYG
ncbi:MAG: cytosine permease, partial [Alphaproteobacteria bacterium]